MKLLTVLVVFCCVVPFGTTLQQAVNGPSTVKSPLFTKPFLEMNPDDAEYRVHFKEGNTHRDLSCKPMKAHSKANYSNNLYENVPREAQNDVTMSFELHQKCLSLLVLQKR